MKRILGLAVLAGSMLLSPTAFAEKGDWLIRVRAINIQPDNKSDPGTGSLAGTAADAITLDNRLVPEVDFSYFLSKNLALELILIVPQKHDVRLNGASIGSVKHLPPTLTLQYHFMPDQKFRPYVGAGINYTRFSSVNIANGTFNLEKDSWGGALQAGFDVEVGKDKFVNVDLKKLYISSDVINASTGAKNSHLTIDPWVVGVGFGWKF